MTMRKFMTILLLAQTVSCDYDYKPILGNHIGPSSDLDTRADLSCDMALGNGNLNQEFRISSIEDVAGNSCQRITNNNAESIEIKSFSHMLNEYQSCNSTWKLNFLNSPQLDFSVFKNIQIEVEYKLKNYFYYDFSHYYIGFYLEHFEISIAGNNLTLGSLSGYDISAIQGNRHVILTYDLPTLLEPTPLGLLIKFNSNQRETSNFHADSNRAYFDNYYYQNSSITIKSVKLIKRN